MEKNKGKESGRLLKWMKNLESTKYLSKYTWKFVAISKNSKEYYIL